MGQALAQGGFGTVYAAELHMAEGFSRTVAIKVLNDTDEVAQEYAQRLRDEARMLGLIRHRAIVDPLGLINLQGRWAVAMELVPGVDLAQIIALGPIPATAALAIVAECASALHVAYTREGPGGVPLKLLHRDLKPGNIRLTPEGDIKILDFGAGRAEFQAREARTEVFTFGSMSYMAPERMDGLDFHASDIYSLGVVLYEMLTASSLGRCSAAPDRHAARIREVMDHLWKATSGSSEDLVRLTGKLLSYEPTDRPDARALERFCTSLGRRLEGPHFRDWAEQAVAECLPHAPPPTDAELTGLEFTDLGFEVPPLGTSSAPEATPSTPQPEGEPPRFFGETSAATPPPELKELFLSGPSPVPLEQAAAPPEPAPTSSSSNVPASRPRSTPGLWRRFLLPTVLIVLGIGAVSFGASLLTQEAPPPIVQPAPAATLSQPTVPLTLDLPGQREEPTPKATPRPRRASKSTVSRKAPATGRVAISGYAEEVWLVSDAGRQPPGELPVGRYRIQARFGPGEDLKTVGTVSITAAETLHLNCSKVYKTCTPRD